MIKRTISTRLITAGAASAWALGALLLVPVAGTAQSPPPGLAAGLGEATFDSAWSRIATTHFDPGMGGVDWEGVRTELRPSAAAAPSQDSLRTVLVEMLSRLGESHFALVPSGSAPAFEAPESSGGGGGDPGIDVRWIEESLVVTSVRPGSSAEEFGVRPGWAIDTIAGTSVGALVDQLRSGVQSRGGDLRLELWLPPAAVALLRGAEGSMAQVAFRDSDDETVLGELEREVVMSELVRLGNLPPILLETGFWKETLSDGRVVGFLRFTAWFPPIVARIAEAMDELRDADAIVLDLRGNPGGLGGLAMGIGGHFLAERASLGTMRTRGGSLEFVVNPQTVTADGRRVVPYGGPVVILTDPLTASTSEIFAGGLQGLGRATVMGESTAGQALPALLVPLPNGDLLLHAVADFTAPDGSRLEGRGVLPDVIVTPRRAAFLQTNDPLLLEAVQWIRSQ
jgi:carboxyl-terminal processing protease